MCIGPTISELCRNNHRRSTHAHEFVTILMKFFHSFRFLSSKHLYVDSFVIKSCNSICPWSFWLPLLLVPSTMPCRNLGAWLKRRVIDSWERKNKNNKQTNQTWFWVCFVLFLFYFCFCFCFILLFPSSSPPSSFSNKNATHDFWVLSKSSVL